VSDLLLAQKDSEIAHLKERLAYFETRGQKIMDLTAKKLVAQLDGDGDISPAMLTAAIKFLKDQGIVDLNPGGEVEKAAGKILPFPKLSPPSEDQFSTLEADAS
jgi:hypothetical protein